MAVAVVAVAVAAVVALRWLAAKALRGRWARRCPSAGQISARCTRAAVAAAAGGWGCLATPGGRHPRRHRASTAWCTMAWTTRARHAVCPRGRAGRRVGAGRTITTTTMGATAAAATMGTATGTTTATTTATGTTAATAMAAVVAPVAMRRASV